MFMITLKFRKKNGIDLDGMFWCLKMDRRCEWDGKDLDIRGSILNASNGKMRRKSILVGGGGGGL